MFPIQTKSRVYKSKSDWNQVPLWGAAGSARRARSRLPGRLRPDFLRINIYVSVSFYFSICKPTRKAVWEVHTNKAECVYHYK